MSVADRRRDDQALAGRIAAMTRIGTTSATVLLAIGAVCLALYRPAATVLLAAGSGVLILVPAIRLAMLAGHFTRRSETRYAVAAVVVFLAIVAGGLVGLLR